MGEECSGEGDARGTRAAFHSVRLEPLGAEKPRKVVILTTDYVRCARCEDVVARRIYNDKERMRLLGGIILVEASP